MKIVSYGKTDIGKKRHINQDSLLADDGLNLYIVADGMGGHKGGEVASRLAVEELQKYCKKHKGDKNCRDLLDGGINAACASIHEESRENTDLNGMGTTVISLIYEEGSVYVGHVGDSRCYLFREGNIWQVTEDHSLLNEEIRSGRLAVSQAEDFQFKNVITRSVGYESHVAVDIYRRKVQAGDTFLLCSDGLSGLVQINEIAAELGQSGLVDGVDNLINLANARGGEDNITVLVTQVEEV